MCVTMLYVKESCERQCVKELCLDFFLCEKLCVKELCATICV